MIAFLQTYGFWLIFIALFILMMRMHGGHGGHGMGGGCGMGGMEHDQQQGSSARYHQSGAESRSSSEQPHVVPYAENEYTDHYGYHQQDQPRVRELPAEQAESNDNEPLVITQYTYER